MDGRYKPQPGGGDDVPCPLSVTTKHNPYKLVHHDPTSVYEDKTYIIIWMSVQFRKEYFCWQ